MPKYNEYININKQKPVEIVHELKDEKEYQVPSFEEFMKTYENDGNLNYDDLSGGSVGEAKGYGPIIDGWYRDSNGVVHCTQTAWVAPRFYLEVKCLNWGGGGGLTEYLYSTSGALEYAHELERGKYFNVSHEVELKCAILLRDAIRHYERGNRVNGHIKVQGQFWGGYESSYSY